MRSKATTERGSLSPLIIGALLIGALLLAVIADSARIFLAHRELVRLSDSTALVAASALDIGAYYSDSSTDFMPLDRNRALQLAQSWVMQERKSHSQLQNLQIASLVTENGKVKLVLSAEVSEAFFYGLSRAHVMTLTAGACATSERN